MPWPSLHTRHQFRLSLFGHKAVETGAVCLLLMVQGDLAGASLNHLVLASQTGALTVAPLIGLTLTRFARHYANRWAAASFVAVSSFVADAVVHTSHYPGAYTEAAMTALGAFVLSVLVSYTPLGRRVDRLAEGFHNQHRPSRSLARH